MATYDFETITPEQALAIQSTDRIRVAAGTAAQSTVLYDSNERIVITIGARSVVFGQGVSGLTAAADNRFTFPDGSRLYAGDNLANSFTLSATVTGPTSGGAYGGANQDTFVATDGSWQVQGNQGADRITVPFGRNTVYGGQDDDIINFGGLNGQPGNFANGNKGADSILGTAGVDTLLGGQGNDTLDAVGAADFINGNLGDDRISAMGQIFGEGGDDTITVGAFLPSTVQGGDGNDRITIRSETQGGQTFAPVVVVFGGEGNDFLDSQNPTAETLSGGGGDDTIFSLLSTAGDLLDGGDGNDRMLVRGGSSTLLGGAGNDSLDGGDGADTINGGAGFDTMAGGFGADLFIEDIGDSVEFIISSTLNRITHWETSDRIKLRGTFTADQYTELSVENLFSAENLAEGALERGAEVVAVQVGDDVVIFTDISPGVAIHNVIMLVGRTLADIDPSHFI
jgi:Ca2+-binding RTX toxin-like protein